MFWGAFTYNRKGPCYIWALETKKERFIATAEVIKINAKMEATAKEE